MKQFKKVPEFCTHSSFVLLEWSLYSSRSMGRELFKSEIWFRLSSEGLRFRLSKTVNSLA